MTEEQISDFRKSLGLPLPTSVASLLRHCRGFGYFSLEEIRFDRVASVSENPLLKKAILLAQNQEGLKWLLGIDPASGDWGKVYVFDEKHHACVLQAENLANFLEQLFHAAGHQINWLEHITGKVVPALRKESPPGLGVLDAASQSDEHLRRAARELPKKGRIFDMRDAKPGDGFSWGNSRLTATDSLDIFAIIPDKKRLWKWLPFLK
ncbi:MAG: SMI1/KNR4 family protein [Bacteroidia bacterium]